MSGDVQPKKRKDKKRKRADQEYHIQRIQILEEEDIETPSPPMVVNNSDNLDNITIHMNKERATGGHWCAKIIFFALLSVLIAIVGVIIFEYRGSTEVDVPIESSRWAIIFDGWVDDALPTHDVHESSKEDEEEDHDPGEKEEEEEDDHDENNESQTVEESVEEEKESNEIDDGDSREADDEEEEEEDEEDEDEDDEEDDEENSEEEEEEEMEENILYIEESEEQNDDDDEPLEEADESEEQKTVFDEEEDDDDDLLNDDDEMSFEILDVVITHDIEDSSEPLEEIEGEDEIEGVTINDPVGMNAEDDNDDDDENKNQENQEDEPSSVAVKFGVGVALVVAAHFVLVRRWRNVDDFEDDVILTENISPELSRRETIFSSKSLDEHVDVLNDNKNELEEKLNKINNEKFVESKNNEEDNEQQSGTEEELTTYDDTGEDEDDEEEEEEEGDEELEESDNEIVHVDDSDLVAKLEAKYGKLPPSKQSEEEEEEDEEEIDDEDYEDDDDEEDITREDSDEEEDSESEQLYDIKRTKGASTSGTSKPESKNSQGSTSQQKKTDGRQEQPVDILNFDDIEVQEEVENWLMRDFDN